MSDPCYICGLLKREHTQPHSFPWLRLMTWLRGPRRTIEEWIEIYGAED